MIAIDTNVLVRYLTQDDLAQAAVATQLIDRAVERGEPICLSAIVLCELVWVLRRLYRLRKPDILLALNGILANAHAGKEGSRPPAFLIQEDALVREAVAAYASGKGDLADHLIGRFARAAGAPTTYTFDRSAASSPLFKLADRA